MTDKEVEENAARWLWWKPWIERRVGDLTPYEQKRIADQEAVPTSSVCPECRGTGSRDSGGTQPWGESIFVRCDCQPEYPDVPAGYVSTVDVEKLICKKLCIEWSATGMSIASLLDRMDPKPDRSIVKLVRYYMRDNHTFVRLSSDDAEALKQIRDEFVDGWNYGLLGAHFYRTDRTSGTCKQVVHAQGHESWEQFSAKATSLLAELHLENFKAE